MRRAAADKEHPRRSQQRLAASPLALAAASAPCQLPDWVTISCHEAPLGHLLISISLWVYSDTNSASLIKTRALTSRLDRGARQAASGPQTPTPRRRLDLAHERLEHLHVVEAAHQTDAVAHATVASPIASRRRAAPMRSSESTPRSAMRSTSGACARGCDSAPEPRAHGSWRSAGHRRRHQALPGARAHQLGGVLAAIDAPGSPRHPRTRATARSMRSAATPARPAGLATQPTTGNKAPAPACPVDSSGRCPGPRSPAALADL